jgi:hypothetical protein
MTDRRKQQNFQALPHYLSEDIWRSFTEQSRERCGHLLLQHAWKLGLRCPSEGTFGVILNILMMGCSDRGNSTMGSFERYEFLQQLKKEWKRYKGAKKAEDHLYTEYVEVLPHNPEELPAEYKLDALLTAFRYLVVSWAR